MRILKLLRKLKNRVYQVRWPVLNRVYAEGLLFQPKAKPTANIIALPDADHTPEQLAGLQPAIAEESQFARRLAENGYQVLVPVLIDRSLLPKEDNRQTHREWIYRQAFHMGRHLIGYEVQKVMAAIDWFKQTDHADLKLGVAGYGEGGLIAFCSAAIDTRIDAAMVSGYFNNRQEVWNEPIYRNVWGLLTEFGDAEIASLIAPRALVVEYSPLPPEVEKLYPQGYQPEEYSFTGHKGKLETANFEDVRSEFRRIDQLIRPGFQSREFIDNGHGQPIHFGSEKALGKLAQALGLHTALPLSNQIPLDTRKSFDSKERQIRQVKELEDHVQSLVRDSDYNRNEFFLYQAMPEFENRQWSTKRYHPYISPEPFVAAGKEYRQYFWEEVLGKFDIPLLAPGARSKKIYDEVLWTGYEVALDVFEGFIAPGVLLVPKDIKEGEQRPVVVVQHGRNGVPEIVIKGNTSYYDVAAKLADEGFVVYAPYGLFRGEDQYRWLDRKANAVKKTLFSFIVAQHDQTLRWLATLSFVDPSRIAFYGKSYGGETAMRIPAVLEGYALSICSADFGDWTRKVVDTRYHNSFMNTIEWEMPYFNMGSTFSYAEMAYLIFPRPFMVERGRHDRVQPDEWVAYEYAKVEHLYDQFNLKEKTEIEYFNGGHASRNEGVFKFLHKHLNWP
jgi:dienelactone hydrolase